MLRHASQATRAWVEGYKSPPLLQGAVAYRVVNVQENSSIVHSDEFRKAAILANHSVCTFVGARCF